MIDEISVTTREQGSGIHQINDAITQLDQVTQQNAALVELMSAFQVEGGAFQYRASTRPTAAPMALGHK